MGGLINLIKSIFGGILSFISGLLGGKKAVLASGDASKTRKSAGYFLELDDSAAPASQPETQKVSAPVAVAEKPEATTTSAKPTPKQSAKKVDKKAEAPIAASNGSAPVAVATPEKALVAVTTAPKEPQTAEFATKYLVPTSNGGRRRPGANMNPYLDMARNMKAGNN